MDNSTFNIPESNASSSGSTNEPPVIAGCDQVDNETNACKVCN